MKIGSARSWFHLLLLLFWVVVGLLLRFINLDAKPLWTDEFSTIVFSLGNSFQTVPLDQILTSEQLLQPLQPNPEAGIKDVIQNLFTESNHPPLYFVLSHLWFKLFNTTSEGWISAWSARSLSALLGAASIPATFAFGWLAFRSRLVGQTAAAFMAVSPFAIYLAQEARHYTLPLLWILASLACLTAAAKTLRDRTPLPIWICVIWVIVNGLGIATHYFFALTLGAEALVIASLGLVQSWRERGIWHPSAHWRRIWVVTAGTTATGLIWLPVLQNIQEGELTRWIYQGDRSGLAWLEPIGQAIAGWVTMLYMLPIQVDSNSLAIIFGVLLVLLSLWTLPKLYRGWQVQCIEREARLAILVLSVFVGGAIVLFFSFTYFFDTNLTSAFRYNFVYFPAVMVLIGAGLASSWDVVLKITQAPAMNVPLPLLKLLRTSSRKIVVLIWCLSLVGGLMVVYNLGYQKTHRPDVVADAIREHSKGTVLVAIAHQTHGQTGRLMGVALDLQQKADPAPTLSPPLDPYYLLAHTSQNPRSVIAVLRQALNQLSRPLDLWLLNFHEVSPESLSALLEQQNCVSETRNQSVDGYRYRRYRCGKNDFS